MNTEQRKLYEELSHTTIMIWKNSPIIKDWYQDSICCFHEHLLLNAMDTKHMWCECFTNRTRH